MHKPIKETFVIVGMSGGVDSSVAAMLLRDQGYQVAGLFMKNWNEDDGTEYCTAKDDLLDAAHVCQQLGIELHTVNFATDYWDNVFSYFLTEYRAGRTPNPDVLCNREIKFKTFLDHATLLGADRIATGHYARIEHKNNHYRLLKGLDSSKDQSYFLHALDESQLAKALFPLGSMKKTEIRQLAHENNLLTHDKKDSTGICFIGERRFKDFLARYLPKSPGEIITPEGVVVGQHDGVCYYTIGQRHGLHIGGLRKFSEAPWYVAAKHQATNQLVVVQGENHPLLYQKNLQTDTIHWINQMPDFPLHCHAKIRYRQSDQAAMVTPSENGVNVEFATPQRAISPGQFVVFYQDDICLGGGVIK